MSKVIVNIKVDQEEKEQLRKDAHEHHMQISEYIRWLIKKERENRS